MMGNITRGSANVVKTSDFGEDIIVSACSVNIYLGFIFSDK